MKDITKWSITVALAGFLFGFDTVVISGANQPIKALWNTSPLFHGTFIMSMALWGTVLGSLLGGIPTKRLGRKKTLFWIGILFFISAVGSALAQDPYTFSAFRFIGGVGVGISSVAAPIYISEITTSETRGRLGALYQFNIVFGILIAFVSNWLLKGVGGDADWRWMLGVEAIPALAYTLMVLNVPNSPRWLILQRKNEEGGMAVLKRMYDDANAQRHLEEIKADAARPKSSDRLFQKKYKRVLMLGFLVAFFNQLSGINFVLYYAPQILEQAGLGGEESLFNSIAIGAVNLIFTLIGIRLIDRLGRRQLLIIGSIGYIVSLLMVGYCFQASLDFSSTAHLHMPVHCLSCYRTRSHYLGLHIRDLPQPGTCLWAVLGYQYALGVRSFDHPDHPVFY